MLRIAACFTAKNEIGFLVESFVGQEERCDLRCAQIFAGGTGWRKICCNAITACHQPSWEFLTRIELFWRYSAGLCHSQGRLW
jgi:hypothetical protein